MPRLQNRVPSYRYHKASGQAVVTLSGRDHYLGPFNSHESHQEYERLVAEWLTAHRQALKNTPGPTRVDLAASIDAVIVPYLEHAETYYVKNGTATSTLGNVRTALGTLHELYGRSSPNEFGPLALKAVRHKLIEAGLSVRTINDYVSIIKRMFKWAVGNELVARDVYHGLQAVGGLRAGRSPARDPRPIRPVPKEDVSAVLPLVSRHVQAMIQLQRLTGMRPSEVCDMRGGYNRKLCLA